MIRHFITSLIDPPLHEFLLNTIFKEQTFNNILDIGCGTGNSSIALTKFGESVTGYDPSLSMIQESQNHPKVIYTNNLYQLNDEYDLIVFLVLCFMLMKMSFVYIKIIYKKMAYCYAVISKFHINLFYLN